MKGEVKNRWKLVFTVMVGIVFFSMDTQAQEKDTVSNKSRVQYQSTTTTTTTLNVDSTSTGNNANGNINNSSNINLNSTTTTPADTTMGSSNVTTPTTTDTTGVNSGAGSSSMNNGSSGLNNSGAATTGNAIDTTAATTTTTTYVADDDDDDDDDDLDGWAGPRAGIKGGLNISNLIVDNVTSKNARLGFHVGVYAQLFGSRAFTIQPEVNFSTKGNKVESNYGLIDQEYKFNLSYIDIPVLAVFKLGRAAELHVGPYWSYLVGANIDADGDLSSDFRTVDRDNFDKWDYGLVGGLGFNLGKGAQLGARYNYGLNEIAKSKGAQGMLGSTKNSVAQIYLAFNLAADND